MKSPVMIATIILTASSAAAFAGSIDVRRDSQLDQIEAGRESGSITWREGRKLRREQAEIARAEYAMKADGRLSREERRELRDMQNTAEDRIVREKHDGWRRPWWMPRFGH